MLKQSFLLLLLLPLLTFSQTKTTVAKPRFQSSAGISFLAGQWEPSYQWQLVSGFKINNWFAGIGGGTDHYRYRTVPLFVSVRREELFNRAFFAFADAGVSIPSVKDEEKQQNGIRDKFYTGFYSETGVGYAIPSKRKFSLRFSAGYSFRTLKEEIEFPSFWSWPTENSVTEYKYKFHLITLKAVIAFMPK